MERRRFTRWVRIGLLAVALAGIGAVPVVDHASAADGRVYSWCQRC
jgi:hypothetical protein